MGRTGSTVLIHPRPQKTTKKNAHILFQMGLDQFIPAYVECSRLAEDQPARTGGLYGGLCLCQAQPGQTCQRQCQGMVRLQPGQVQAKTDVWPWAKVTWLCKVKPIWLRKGLWVPIGPRQGDPHQISGVVKAPPSFTSRTA